MTKDNINLGKFELSGIPPAPRGTPQIEVTFEINADGILNVAATDKATGNSKDITITADKNLPSQEEVEEMIRSAKEFEEEDKRLRETVEARNQLESTAYSLLSGIDDEEKLGGKLSEDDKETIKEACEEANEIVQPIVQDLYGEGGPGGDEYDDEDDEDD